MASVTLPGGIRVALEFNVNDKVVLNIYHVVTTDPIISVKLIQVAQVFVDWWTVDVAPIMSHNIALANVTALDISVANGSKEDLVQIPPIQGSITEGAVSNNVALVASLRTALTGRSFQGRSYHAGLNVTAVTGNDIGVSKAAALATGYVGLLSTLVGNNDQLVVASFVSGGVPRVTGVGTPVNSVAVKLRVDTQRRRLPRE